MSSDKTGAWFMSRFTGEMTLHNLYHAVRGLGDCLTPDDVDSSYGPIVTDAWDGPVDLWVHDNYDNLGPCFYMGVNMSEGDEKERKQLTQDGWRRIL